MRFPPLSSLSPVSPLRDCPLEEEVSGCVRSLGVARLDGVQELRDVGHGASIAAPGHPRKDATEGNIDASVQMGADNREEFEKSLGVQAERCC